MWLEFDHKNQKFPEKFLRISKMRTKKNIWNFVRKAKSLKKILNFVK